MRLCIRRVYRGRGKVGAAANGNTASEEKIVCSPNFMTELMMITGEGARKAQLGCCSPEGSSDLSLCPQLIGHSQNNFTEI